MIDVYYIYGESQLVDAKVQKIVDEHLPADIQAYELQQLDGELVSLAEVEMICASVSFLAEKRVVVIRHADQLGRQADSTSEKNFLAFLEAQTADAVLLLSSYENKAPTGFIKKVATFGQTISLTKPQGVDFDRWAQSQVKPYHRSLSRDALAWLQYRSHITSLDTIAQDLAKASLYVLPETAITANDLEKVATVALEESVFKIIDAITGGNPQKAIAAWENNTAARDNVYGFFNLLLKNIEQILIVHNYRRQGLGLAPIQNRMKANPYAIKKAFQKAGSLSEKKLRQAYLQMAKMDLRLKSVGGIQVDDEITDLIIDLAYLFKA